MEISTRMSRSSSPRSLLVTLLVFLACCSPSWSITVTSRGDPRDSSGSSSNNSPQQVSVSTSPLSGISSQNFTVALQLLERMLLTQQRQRRLIPYYSWHGDHQSLYSAAPVPTPFPVQNTALDLLSRSLFSPYNLRGTSFAPSQLRSQHSYSPRPYTTTHMFRPSYTDLFQQLLRSRVPVTPAPSKAPPPVDVYLSPETKVTYQYPYLSRGKGLPLTIKQLPLSPEELDNLTPPVTPEPVVSLPVSLPKLLSPLASVTRFPGPSAKKAGKDAPGRPGVDYPTFHKIPHTSFSCATQRYKGFFADTETNCQVWHYCDLNGGQASFLCPNGTIFSQVLLTCDWWFNVKCTNTLQAYVLNERLYKFIMPKRPSFPEDFTGFQVDDYLVQKQSELREKEVAKAERLKKKYKPFEFDDVDELQALLDKMRRGEPLEEHLEQLQAGSKVQQSNTGDDKKAPITRGGR